MDAPFITYLTVFQSRLASVNMLLPATSYGHTARESLVRKTKKTLEEKVEVDLDLETNLLSYLLAKKFVGPKPRKDGRYPGYAIEVKDGRLLLVDPTKKVSSRFKALRIDVWMADPSLPSTVGVPTPDNVEEVIDLAHEVGMLTRNKCSWTAAGHASLELRKLWGHGVDNPMRIGPDVILGLRQVLGRDSLLMDPILERLSVGTTIRRDEFSRDLAGIAATGLEKAKTLRFQPESIRKGREFVELLTNTAKKRDKQTDAPGVLEHRMTPRLEWLTDCGVLAKPQDAKNGFAYTVTDDAPVLLSALRGNLPTVDGGDQASVTYWHSARAFEALRQALSTHEPDEALREAYRMMKRSVGPTSIREVCLLAAILSRDPNSTVKSLEERVVKWAGDNKAVKLSGGRFGRGPEMVYVPDSELRRDGV